MSHLSSAEFIDYVEGTLASTRAAHVRDCERCRTQADAIGRTLARTSDAQVPEPSPLFWEHFSSRVHEAVASERPDASWGFRVPWLRPMPVALAAALVILVAAVSVYRAPFAVRPPAGADVVASSSPGSGAATPTAVGDEAWDLVSDAASGIELEDAHDAGFTVHPGEIDRAVVDMTPVERAALGRLLQRELKRAGA
jgi:hypothetical protein